MCLKRIWHRRGGCDTSVQRTKPSSWTLSIDKIQKKDTIQHWNFSSLSFHADKALTERLYREVSVVLSLLLISWTPRRRARYCAEDYLVIFQNDFFFASKEEILHLISECMNVVTPSTVSLKCPGWKKICGLRIYDHFAKMHFFLPLHRNRTQCTKLILAKLFCFRKNMTFWSESQSDSKKNWNWHD